MRAHVAEECKNDYAAQLQKFNKEQNQFYFSDMPLIFNVSKLLPAEKIHARSYNSFLKGSVALIFFLISTPLGKR